MIAEVAIQGDGVAATCCAKLLSRRGIAYAFEPNRADRRRPTLLMNSQSEKLIADVFEGELLNRARPVRRRGVLWGPAESEPKWFPHSGFAVAEGELLERLWAGVPSRSVQAPDWLIRSVHSAAPHEFGERVATNVNVKMKHGANDACCIESLDEGWLFLLPAGEGLGSLIAVGGEPSTLIEESRFIGPQVTEVIGTGARFASAPRISIPLCEPGWLACGSAAMAFDPICGEGAGNAVREAILAAAVLGRIHEGADTTAVLGEYTARLIAGFGRHLELCRQFYTSGRRSDWWDEQVKACEHGLEWTRAQLSAAPSPSSRLVGFDLVFTAQQ